MNSFDSKIGVEEFPYYAKNQQEERYISRELSSEELKNIPVGPVTINIGEIIVKAT